MRDVLRGLYLAAIESADPTRAVSENLPPPPTGRCVVVGAGKAAAGMALAVERAWPEVDVSGVVVVPDGHAAPLTRIAVCEASHPVPDARSHAAATRIMDAVRGLTENDLVLALMSGGGSSVMALPAAGVSMSEKQLITRALLDSGLDIRTFNAVRRRLSAIKGGKLAAAATPARLITLAISDVPGDDPAAIASGPTVPDPDQSADLTWVLDKLKLAAPHDMLRELLRPAALSAACDAPNFKLVATPTLVLANVADLAKKQGFNVVNLGANLEGESRDLGAQIARFALMPAERPTLIISGGETTVTLSHRDKGGRGGRNTEFLLSLAIALDGAPGIWALSADTDGIDGGSIAAGAFISPDTLKNAMARGLSAADHLTKHDSASFFDALGDLLITGPTRTNVNDFRAIIIIPQ